MNFIYYAIRKTLEYICNDLAVYTFLIENCLFLKYMEFIRDYLRIYMFLIFRQQTAWRRIIKSASMGFLFIHLQFGLFLKHVDKKFVQSKLYR